MEFIDGPPPYDLPGWRGYRAEWMRLPDDTPGKAAAIAEADRVIATLTGEQITMERAADKLSALAAEIRAEEERR